MAAEGSNDWKHGLFGCNDSGIMQLVYMYVFGQCAYGHAMEEIGNGTCLMCCLFGTACACCNRAKVRDKYDIKGDCMNDYLMWLFCSACAMFQELQEVADQSGKEYAMLGALEAKAGLAR